MTEAGSSFFTATFNVEPLQQLFSSITARMTAVEERCASLEETNSQLQQTIKVANHRAEVSQKQFEALFDSVATLNNRFSDLKDNFISRPEVIEKIEVVQKNVDEVNDRCDDLDNRKLDEESEDLEHRVKDQAATTCNLIIAKKDTEQRDWICGRLADSELKLTDLLVNSQRELRTQVESELDFVKQTAEEEAAQGARRHSGVEAQLNVFASVNRGFAAKLEKHERDVDSVEDRAQREFNELHRNIKAITFAFGVQLSDILSQIGAQDLLENVGDVHRAFERDVARRKRKADAISGWKLLRATSEDLGQVIEKPAEEPLDVRALEVKRDDRVRSIEAKQRAAENEMPAPDSRPKLSRAAQVLEESPLLREILYSSSEQVTEQLTLMRQELASDVGAQLSTLQREMRQKVGSQRCVELIEQYASETVRSEARKLQEKMDTVASTMMHRDDIITLVSGKADAKAMLMKADSSALDLALQELEEKFSETVEATSQKMSALVDRKAKELGMEKLDRRDPTYLNLVHTAQNGGLQSVPAVVAQSSQNGERCITCNRPSSASMSARSHQSMRDADVAQQQNREADFKQTQARLHKEQMDAARGPASVHMQQQQAAVDAQQQQQQGQPYLADWVQKIDLKYKTRTLVAPHPPSSAGTAKSNNKQVGKD